MKKKMLFFMATIAAFALFVPSVMAASEPELVEISSKKIFLANGTEITIEAPKVGTGALIKWEGGELEVTADTTIVGGMHNSDTEVNTSIVMNGGTVKHIFAGGLHKSYVDTSYVALNGGTVTGSIMGGGYAGYVNDADFSTSTYNPADIEADSIVRVNEATIEINGGTIGEDVFGGGGGYSYTGTVSITIAETFTGSIGYLSGGGSNGHTGTASVEVNGGEIGVLQAVNRGSMEESTLVINGGEVTDAYVSSEGDGTNITGVTGNASLYVNGGTVTNVSAGGVPATTTNPTEINVTYKDGTVTNVNDDLEDNNLVVYVDVTLCGVIDGKVGQCEVEPLEKGTLIPKEDFEKALVDELKKENKYIYDATYADKDLKTKFDFSKALDTDTTMYVSAKTNPKTGDINLGLLIGTILVGMAGVAVVLRKRFAKSN